MPAIISLFWVQIGIEAHYRDPGPGGVDPQTRQVFSNLGSILSAAGFTFKDVVYVQVFLADMNDFSELNAIYATFFSNTLPARTAVEVAALPKGALVEITLQAVRTS